MSFDFILSELLKIVGDTSFIYTIIIILIIVIFKNIYSYPAYKRDCDALGMKPKPFGFAINTLFSMFQLATIILFLFVGIHSLPPLPIFMPGN